MSDPQPAEAGRDEPDPAAESAGSPLKPDDLQFPSRKSRRLAETTGTIPTVPPPRRAYVPAVPTPPAPIAPIPAAAVEVPARPSKAGRNLPAAIGVGLALLVLVIGSLLLYPAAFIVLAAAFACIGVWEVTRSIARRGIVAPMPPIYIGAAAMPAAAYLAGAEGLLFAFVASCAAVLLWRCLDSTPGAVHSILAGIFALTWIPFLLGFVSLMLRDSRAPTLGWTLEFSDINPGVLQIVITLLLVVANDTFGYLVGVLFGKHPMAPKISPKKSWEGFAGSVGGAVAVGILATVFLLQENWWVGLVLAVGIVLAGTGGDFAESMIKRELGVKDMSNILPGHGGMMDRLDSILFSAPIAFMTFSVLGRI
ncbi:phosphatidate cytidylyltransferase [Specibacter cremeus]|uniref:phosphatidate cytidylyltransferase n=1 Tax=Specibacter cremeus TaxID=1629051 RepID=UPI000F784E37|nr:phosphatidate cytidylyltransferase [Specibacter cremeus]